MARKMGGLGKGLSAIFVENETEGNNEVLSLRISQIEPNRNQPRRNFDTESLAELASSIEKHGVLQPILVRPQIHGGYQIVAGERRYRASRLAGLTEIPVIVRDLSDSEMMQIALIENLQREDLSPLEEAAGYRSLIDDYGFTQDEVARTVGKSRSAVTNMLRLLNLPDDVRPLLEEQKLSAGHARALLAIEDKDKIKTAADKVVKENLSVRATEALAKQLNKEKEAEPEKTVQRQPSLYREVELSLSEELGTKVNIVPFKKKAGGTLCVEFYDPAELFKLTQKLSELWHSGDEDEKA